MQDPQMKIRIPVDLKEWVEGCAQKNRRSLNAEVIFRLERSREVERGEKGDGTCLEN